MQLAKVRREVEKDEEKEGRSTGDHIEIVEPSPAFGSILNEQTSNCRTRCRKRDGRTKKNSVNITTMFVRNQLADNESKGQLNATGYANENAGADQS